MAGENCDASISLKGGGGTPPIQTCETDGNFKAGLINLC